MLSCFYFLGAAAGVDFVRLKGAVIRDRGRKTSAIPEMAGIMPVAASPGPRKREVDHRSQQQCRSKRVFPNQGLGPLS